MIRLIIISISLLLIASLAVAASLERYGAESADDGQESGVSGFVNISFNYIELVWSLDRWGGAYRFPNITIPQGATIDSSYMSIWSYSTSWKTANDTIACEDVDSATILVEGYNDNISNRWVNATTAKVFWHQVISSSLVRTRIDCELKTLVQEVVDRPGWKSGNAIMFLFKNRGAPDSSAFETYSWDMDDHTYGGKLSVYYSTEEAPPETASYVLDSRFIPEVYDPEFQRMPAGAELRFGIQSIYSNAMIMRILEDGEKQRIFVGKI